MSSFNIIKTSKVSNSFRTNVIKGMFEIDKNEISEQFVGEINLPESWNVGLIYGASGTGKSTIAKQLFPAQYIRGFVYNKDSVIDDMPESCDVKTITKTFSNVGFASVPSWLKPYDVLSNGEKMRVDLARAILEKQDFIVFDEFTSVVDRQVAKFGSHTLQKAVRKMNKKFVAVSCHKDIIDWLEPDWTFCTDTMTFSNVKKNAQKSNCNFANAQNSFGSVLKNIII